MLSSLYLPRELIVVLLGMLPVLEVRGAIPVAALAFNMPLEKAYVLSVLGNILPIMPLLIFFERVVEYLSHRSYWANRFFAWLFERTRRRHGDHFHYWKWAPFALFVFVAIPLPMTGAWSGVVAAIVFGIPLFTATIAIALGVAAAGGIVAALVHFGILTMQAFL